MRKFTLLFFIMTLINTGLFAQGIVPLGDGTQSNPYQIAILDNLLWLSTTHDLPQPVYIIQTADIDAADTQNWDHGVNGAGMRPIGLANYHFVVFYDGLNHTITNLYQSFPWDHAGMFGIIYNSVISNLTLINTVNESDCKYVGALVGRSYSSSIVNCASENGDISGAFYVGGLVGDMRLNDESTGDSEILFCFATGSVYGNSWVGGLIATVQSTLIDNCYVVMDDVIAGADVGGFLGNSYGCEITNCMATADVYVSGNAGRAGGFAHGLGNSTVNNCSSEGEVLGDDYLGGFSCHISNNSVVTNCFSSADVYSVWGTSGGFLANNQDYAVIKNCYSYGYVDDGGGFAGDVSSDYIVCENNFWDVETSSQTSGLEYGNQTGITGKSHADMLSVATYTDTTTNGLNTAWDFLGDPFDDNQYEDIWNIDGTTNNGYPFFADPIYTAIQEQKPEKVLLKNNYPNPFSYFTSIAFSIEKDSRVELIIYNFKGQKITTLTDKKYLKGEYTLVWDRTDENNCTVLSGMYFYQLNVNNRTIAIKKCILIN